MKLSLTRMAQRKSRGRKALRHTSGAAPSTLDFVNIGMDVLNPTQAPDAHMGPGGLEWDFGDTASHHGDIRTSLASSPPGQVQVEVERSLSRPAPPGHRTVSCYGSASEARSARVVCFSDAGPELSDPIAI